MRNFAWGIFIALIVSFIIFPKVVATGVAYITVGIGLVVLAGMISLPFVLSWSDTKKRK
jgi:uncharacterized membrane protein YdfJ with MMPL/SSD domain